MAKLQLIAVAVLAAVTPAFAQVTCSATSKTPTLRYEALTDFAGEILITCNGSAPSGITGFIQVGFTNTNVSSRSLGGGNTEAILQINEPSNPSLGFDAFRATPIGGNILRWSNVPIAPMGFNGSRKFRLSNMRVNTNALASGTSVNQVTVSVLISGTPAVTLTNPNMVVGLVNAKGSTLQRPLGFTLGGEAFTPSNSAQKTITLTFQTGFEAVMRTSIAGGQDPSIPGMDYIGAEAGFVNTGSFGSDTGTATTATRLVARFTNVPAGVNIFATVGPVSATAGFGGGMVAGDLNGAGGGFVSGSSMFGGVYRQVQVSAGSGTATWEITGADPTKSGRLTFNAVVQGITGTGLGQMSVTGGLAPMSTNSSSSGTSVAAPRFVDNRVSPYVDLGVGSAVQTTSGSVTSQTGPVRRDPIVQAGSNVTFVHTVASQGPVDAQQVQVVNNLPSTLTLVSCVASGGGTCNSSGGTVIATFPSVRPGEAPTVSITAKVDNAVSDGTQIQNSVTISSLTTEAFMNDNTTTSTFTVQKPPCVFLLSRSGASVGPSGDLGKVNVTTDPGCAWASATNSGFITFTPTTPTTGSGTLYYTVAANATAAARSGVLLIGGVPFTINQSAPNCAFSVTPSSQTIDFGGGGFTGTVTTTAGCSWNAIGAPSFITITSGGSTVTGPGTLAYTVAVNNTTAPRTGVINAGGQAIQLIQKISQPTQIFQDVGLAHPYVDYITLLRQNNVTSGCTATQYCPDENTTRGQMSVFIIRSLLGETFSFPTAPFFTDVPATHPYFKYIQKMRELGITSGCTAATYCPDDAVTRGQMAVFLIRGRLGITPVQTFPVIPAPIFADVPATHPYFTFIQKMRELGITTGCDASNYCPDASTTRGQMAVFLIRAFYTP